MVVKGMGGLFAGREFDLKGSLVFGRSRQGCDINFPDNTKGVSRTHCKVDATSGGVTLTDIGSSYGTFLNGRKLPPYTATPVKEGDVFWLGDRSNSFGISGGSGSASAAVPAKGANGKNKLIMISVAAAAAMAIIAVILILVLGNRKESLIGTWKVAEQPGARLSFAENGDLLFTDNGEYTINGSLTYSPAGEHMISVKYSAPQGLTEGTGSVNAWIFNIGGGRSQYDAYQQGVIWKYEFSGDKKTVTIYDVNGYKLFSLEGSE